MHLFRYLLLRISLWIPALFLTLLLCFFLMKLSPGDVVRRALAIDGVSEHTKITKSDYDREYQLKANQLNLNKPIFYFTVLPSYYPDTLYRFIHLDQKSEAKELISQFKSWPEIEKYLASKRRLLANPDNIPASQLYLIEHARTISDIQKISSTQSLSQLSPDYNDYIESLQRLFQVKPSTFLFPKIVWYGKVNQFHLWFSNLAQGNFGHSLIDGKPVFHKIKDAFSWTFFLATLSIILTTLISIPLGIYSAIGKNKWIQVIIDNALFILYSLPLFFLATLMIIYFTTDEYGSWTNIFPNVGINLHHSSGSTMSNIFSNLKQLILPIFCITLSSAAYLTRYVKSSLIREFKKDYVLAALTRGLSEKQVIRHHALPNALIPLITVITAIFPAAMAGSVVLEVIFNIPGMGRLLFTAINNFDWPIVVGILIIIAVFTSFSYLIGDVLYRMADPRIKYHSSKSEMA